MSEAKLLNEVKLINADYNIELAWDKFCKVGEISNYAESILDAAETYRTSYQKCKDLNQEMYEMLDDMIEQFEYDGCRLTQLAKNLLAKVRGE